MMRCATCGRRLRDAVPGCAVHGPAPATTAVEAPGAAEPMPAFPGFAAERVLGRGGFGTVYLAQRQADGHRVAIKTARADNHAAKASLVKEVDALKIVGPPVVPAVLGEGTLPDGTPWVAMDLIAAPTLSKIWEEEQGPWDPLRALRVVRALAHAMAIAHERGLVHRDVKPENFFVELAGDDVRAWVFDFGLVAPSGATPDPNAAGEGTPEYMPPEQFAADQPIAPSADVYALAVTLYEMLAGAPPFHGALADVREGHRSLRPPRFAVALAIPAELEDLVLRCLAKDRERRLADAAALRDELDRLRPIVIAARAAAVAKAAQPAAPIAASPVAAPAAPAAASARSDQRPLGLVFFKPKDGRQVGPGEYKLLGGDAASLSPTLGQVMAFGHEAGENPVKAALRAAERLLELGLASRVLVDTFAVTVQVRPNGARRYLSQVFTKADRYPASTDPEGVLLTLAALELLPQVEATPIPNRPSVFRMVPSEQRELTMVGAGPRTAVGRDEELARLSGSARRSVRERLPGLAVVTAEAGLGKSDVAAALVAKLPIEFPEARLIALRCQEGLDGGQSKTLRELTRLAIDLPRARPEDGGAALFSQKLGAELAERHWAPLAFLHGWVDTDRPELKPLLAAPGALRLAVAQAAGTVLRLCAARAGAVLVIDDAHLADEATLDALEFAALEEGGAPVWICALARPTLDLVRPAFGLRSAEKQRLKLGPLSPEASAALARILLEPAQNVPAAALRKIAERTQGNPLLLVELVRGLKRDGAIKRDSKGQHQLATDEIDKLPDLPVVAWIATREIEALPPELAAHARIASLLGSDLAAEELEGVIALGEREGRTFETQLDAAVGLRRLCDAGVLVKHRSGRFSFRYGVLRDATYNLVPPAKRKEVHEVAFRYFRDHSRAAEDERLPRVALHAAQAGLREQAAALYITLAERMRERHAYVEAEQLYSKARAELAAEDDVRIARVAHGQGLMRFRMGRYEKALSDLGDARSRAEKLGDRRLQLDLVFDMGTVLDFLDSWPAAKELTAQAATLMGDSASDLDRARLRAAEARDCYRLQAESGAIDVLRDAVTLAERVGDAGYEPLIACLQMLVSSLAMNNRVDEALAMADKGITLAREHGDRFAEAGLFNNRIFAWLPSGNMAKLREDLETTLAIARENGFIIIELRALHNLAETAYLSGDFQKAERFSSQNVELFDRVSGESLDALVNEMVLWARILWVMGQPEKARGVIDEVARRRAEATAPGETRPWQESVHVLFDTIELATRDPSDAEWQALLERSARDSTQEEPIEVWAIRALAARRRGELAAARQAMAHAAELCKTIPNLIGGLVAKWLAEIEAEQARLTSSAA